MGFEYERSSNNRTGSRWPRKYLGRSRYDRRSHWVPGDPATLEIPLEKFAVSCREIVACDRRESRSRGRLADSTRRTRLRFSTNGLPKISCRFATDRTPIDLVSRLDILIGNSRKSPATHRRAASDERRKCAYRACRGNRGMDRPRCDGGGRDPGSGESGTRPMGIGRSGCKTNRRSEICDQSHQKD